MNKDEFRSLRILSIFGIFFLWFKVKFDDVQLSVPLRMNNDDVEINDSNTFLSKVCLLVQDS